MSEKKALDEDVTERADIFLMFLWSKAYRESREGTLDGVTYDIVGRIRYDFDNWTRRFPDVVLLRDNLLRRKFILLDRTQTGIQVLITSEAWDYLFRMPYSSRHDKRKTAKATVERLTNIIREKGEISFGDLMVQGNCGSSALYGHAKAILASNPDIEYVKAGRTGVFRVRKT